MISTKNLKNLPNSTQLKSVCKAICVMDAILSPNWQYRYYNFNSTWDVNQSCLLMRNGSGDEMLILFHEQGCCINGFSHEYKAQGKKKLTFGLPGFFNEFMFDEPVNSIGTTFCIWSSGNESWQTGQIENDLDGSTELLKILDGNPNTYIEWATDYFAGKYKKDGIPFNTVFQIYNGKPLTKEMVLSIVEKVDDWETLKEHVNEIDYPYDFN